MVVHRRPAQLRPASPGPSQHPPGDPLARVDRFAASGAKPVEAGQPRCSRGAFGAAMLAALFLMVSFIYVEVGKCTVPFFHLAHYFIHSPRELFQEMISAAL